MIIQLKDIWKINQNYKRPHNYFHNSSVLNTPYFKGIKVKYIGKTIGNLIEDNIYEVTGQHHKNNKATLDAGCNVISLKGINIEYEGQPAGVYDTRLEIADERFERKLKRYNLKETLIQNYRELIIQKAIEEINKLQLCKHKDIIESQKRAMISILKDKDYY